MAKRLELQIHNPSSGTPFIFDVEGEWLPRWEFVWDEAANPPAPSEARLTWEIRGCRLVSSDGTTAALWASIATFRTLIESRADHPQWARLVRDPAGAAVTLLTLGSTDSYEQFRVEEVAGELDAFEPDASWRTTASFTLRLSAVSRKASETKAAGVVSFSQEVSIAYGQNGLRTLSWRTRLTTLEGSSAVEAIKTYGRIPDEALGSDHSWITNGPDGLDLVYTDADEGEERIPTVAEAFSAIQQHGFDVGVTEPGSSPGSFSLETRVTTRAEKGETITETEVTASATGPGAEEWVGAQAPGGPYAEDGTSYNSATREAAGRWVKRASSTTPAETTVGQTTTIEASVSGGHRVRRWRGISGGLPPNRVRGAFLPWQLDVTITVTQRGGTGLLTELPLPPLLPSPWELEENESSEGLPRVPDEGRASDPAQNQWVRVAKLVYRSRTRPTENPLVQLQGGTKVPTYYLTGAADAGS